MRVELCKRFSILFIFTFVFVETKIKNENSIFAENFRGEKFSEIPFCLPRDFYSILNDSKTLEEFFYDKIAEEETKLFPPQLLVPNWKKSEIEKFSRFVFRQDGLNVPLVARAANKICSEIFEEFSCKKNRESGVLINEIFDEIFLPSRFCPFEKKIDCSQFEFDRSFSGICNNLIDPYRGAAATSFARILPAIYEDGLSKSRSFSVLGARLPSCRRISLSLESKPFYDIAINHFWPIFGQFISYDIARTLSIDETGRKTKNLCSCESKDEDFCNVIPLPSDDPFFAPQKCIELKANAQTFSNSQCKFSTKEQINGVSHFLDLSFIYGNDENSISQIRTGSNGLIKLKTNPKLKLEMSPIEFNSRLCSDANSTQKQIVFGDSRVTQNLILTGIQSQWLRAHNRISNGLLKVRPSWRNQDEALFIETRKILIALQQHFTYTNWLPILIGDELVKERLVDEHFFSVYNESILPETLNEVASGVLRLHTFVRDTVTRCRPNGEFIDQRPLVEIVGKCKFAFDFENNGLDSFLCGALHDYSYAGDSNYASELHHRLFEEKDEKNRFKRKDILSINICRARENGIPDYNSFRQICGLKKAERFEDFSDVMTIESIEKLKSIYADPNDVDLLVGANFEKWHKNGVVGSVSACLIAEQFYRLKYGDRFFYTHQHQFSREQLTSIRNYKLQCFFCHTTDIEQVQRDPFRPPEKNKNPTDLCSECPELDLNPWRSD